MWQLSQELNLLVYINDNLQSGKLFSDYIRPIHKEKSECHIKNPSNKLINQKGTKIQMHYLI